MKLNKIAVSILNSLGLVKKSTHNENHIEIIGEVPVTSIIIGFEYYETDFGITCKFRVTENIKKDTDGSWLWRAINLKTEKETDVVCKSEYVAYWPNIIAA